MATRSRRPPVIPEIAKAYQNDPRTLLARAAMETGTSGAPVAQGQYAYADGAARALQALAGAYVDRKSMDRYAADEAELLAQRKARGVDGLSGAAATPLPTPAPQQPAAQPQAAAVASALGAAPPETPVPPPGRVPGLQSMADSVPITPFTPQGQGAAPGRTVPFGRSEPVAASTRWDVQPELEEVPDAPEPIARPTAPQAVGPTRSKLLDAAYRIMLDANPYESASGQEMYVSGLSDQDKLNEAAAEREQRLRDMGYQADLGVYSDAQSQDRGNRYQERRDTLNRNFEATESFKGRQFQGEQAEKDRAFRRWETQFSASTQFALQRSSQAFQAGQALEQRKHELKLKGIGDAEAAQIAKRERADKYLNTAAGQKFTQGNQDIVNSSAQTIATLGAFERRMAETGRTGGMLVGNAPGLVKWANKDYQVLAGLSNQLALNLAKDMKGSLSDKDVKFLTEIVPSIKNGKGANRAQIAQLRAIARRQQDYAISRQRAVENGEGSAWMVDWSAYTNSVDANTNTDFQTWRATRPAYDRNGNPVRR